MINLMVACAENRVMGRKNRLPWRIPEDLRLFHEETAGKTIILGRICYETWPRAREDGRRLIVITSNPSLERDGVRVARSVPEALEIAEAMPGEIYVNGGERIFEGVSWRSPAPENCHRRGRFEECRSRAANRA